MPSPSHVNRYLDRTDFPADRNKLITRARDRGAPRDVLNAMEHLPDREYANETDLFSALPEGEGTAMGRTGEGEPG